MLQARQKKKACKSDSYIQGQSIYWAKVGLILQGGGVPKVRLEETRKPFRDSHLAAMGTANSWSFASSSLPKEKRWQGRLTLAVDTISKGVVFLQGCRTLPPSAELTVILIYIYVRMHTYMYAQINLNEGVYTVLKYKQIPISIKRLNITYNTGL